MMITPGPKMMTPPGPKMMTPPGPKMMITPGPKMMITPGPKMMIPRGPKMMITPGPKITGNGSGTLSEPIFLGHFQVTKEPTELSDPKWGLGTGDGTRVRSVRRGTPRCHMRVVWHLKCSQNAQTTTSTV